MLFSGASVLSLAIVALSQQSAQAAEWSVQVEAGKNPYGQMEGQGGAPLSWDQLALSMASLQRIESGGIVEKGDQLSRARLNLVVFVDGEEDQVTDDRTPRALQVEGQLHLNDMLCAFTEHYPVARTMLVHDRNVKVSTAPQVNSWVDGKSELKAGQSSWQPATDSDSVLDLATTLMATGGRLQGKQGTQPDTLIVMLSSRQAPEAAALDALEHSALEQYVRVDMRVVRVKGGNNAWAFVAEHDAVEIIALSATERRLQEGTTWDTNDVIMVWTIVVFALILLVVFCCVSWSTELDPLLKVGFKSDATVKHD